MSMHYYIAINLLIKHFGEDNLMLLISHDLYIFLLHFFHNKVFVVLPISFHDQLILDPPQVSDSSLGLHVIVFVEMLHAGSSILRNLLQDSLLMDLCLD